MNTRRKARKAAAFTPVAMKAVIGAGSPFVDVRRPHVEGHGRDLEAEPDGQEGHSEDEQERRPLGPCHDRLGDDRRCSVVPVAP